MIWFHANREKKMEGVGSVPRPFPRETRRRLPKNQFLAGQAMLPTPNLLSTASSSLLGNGHPRRLPRPGQPHPSARHPRTAPPDSWLNSLPVISRPSPQRRHPSTAASSKSRRRHPKPRINCHWHPATAPAAKVSTLKKAS